MSRRMLRLVRAVRVPKAVGDGKGQLGGADGRRVVRSKRTQALVIKRWEEDEQAWLEEKAGCGLGRGASMRTAGQSDMQTDRQNGKQKQTASKR